MIKALSALLGLLFVGTAAFSAEPESKEWKPAKGPLTTRWTSAVDPLRVHPEYPRPQMVRPDWVNLNGIWEYAVRPKDSPRPESFDGKILVPFPIESALSGVMKPVKPDERLWYRKTLKGVAPIEKKRWLLHFGAVDWESSISINGKTVGDHRGGYDPFTLDITEALLPGETQEILLSVWDPTDTGSQPRGKQVLKPGGIMYTANTGIWQTVWLEPVPERHIERLSIVPDIDAGEVRVSVKTAGPIDNIVDLRVRVLDGQREVASATSGQARSLAVKLPDARLWSPERPFLYNLIVSIPGGDEVRSYFGMRKISMGKDPSGINRLFLNNKPVFQFGPLDQGWWPDGLYAAPTDEALRYDIEMTRKLGFNMIRKHVKVEPERWYYWCDTLGMLVWQDMPSGDNKDDAAKRQFAVELERMMNALRNHPSIVMWVPFNEGWGQHETPRVVDWVKNHDPTRLVNNASGWTDSHTGDVSDMHNYPGPGMPPTESKRAAVLGEFGGLGLPLQGHVWVDKNNWGYRTFKNTGELVSAYGNLIPRLQGLIAMGLSAAVYTQTTDVEVEVNGLMTYDRAVLKLPGDVAAAWHADLYGPTPIARTILPTAQTSPLPWKYTIKAPPAGWFNPEYDDAAWSEGEGGFGTKGTPGALVHTDWSSRDIWLRREFKLGTTDASNLHLLIHHDEDAEIWINGLQVASLKGYTSAYELVKLDQKAVEALRQGRNILAVHCQQTSGGQYIDVGLVDFKAARVEAAAVRGAGGAFSVGRPPASLGLSRFYKKHVSVEGLPVIGSEKVSDFALKEAAYLINRMLSHRDDIRQAMIRNKVRFAVMACSERTTDIPEHSDLTPRTYWNVRSRGLGATSIRPAVSCGEENLLNYAGDPYDTENILIHEFAHAIHEMGLTTVEPGFDERLKHSFQASLGAGRWRDTYAATNHHEYWAEGVQSWFDTNRQDDNQHNHVNTRDELKKYDPALAELIEQVFGDDPWRYTRPARGDGRTHLVGYDPGQSPKFAWEPELIDQNRHLRGDRGRKASSGSAASPAGK